MTNDPKAKNTPQTDGSAALSLTAANSEVDVQKAFDTILQDVIKPVSGDIDGKVTIHTDTDPPVLVLQHTATNRQGHKVDFKYEIQLGAPRLQFSEIPEPGDSRILKFPDGPYTSEELVKLQDAFRCACIDDPLLYPRYHRGVFELEDYQKAAVKAGLDNLRETGVALLVLGTGAGKTEIAFEIATQELARAERLEDAAVLFIVNNNIILTEAGSKFDRRFSDSYSKSHAHGGQRDTLGHVVFATPATILGNGELEKFLATKKQVLLIFDEVHHVVASQPDAIIKRATDFASQNAVELSILGMTATETRPDLRSVLSYFNNHISFELSAATLTSRGFLAPFRYHAYDNWLYPEGSAPRVILPNDEIAAERKALLNSTAAFIHIEKALKAHSLTKDNQQTLIVAPSVELAGQLVAHLNTLPEYEGRVVRLTSEDKTDRDSALLFAHTYEAWKTGAWPPNSLLAKEPVPTIVVAVDLFKEGADAPGVRTIINWADTNSLIVFLQTLGRGLRPDPFKTHLDVIDLAGTFRKVHLLQWLGNASESDGRRRGGDSQGTERSSRFEHAGRPSCDLSDEVSQTVKAFLADIPQTLARRYPKTHYSALPTHEIERLHECLAERLGFKDVIKFEHTLRDLGIALLNESNSVTSLIALRDKLVPAFFNDASLADSRFIPHEAATLLIHAHLMQTIQLQVAEFTPGHFAKVFPQFSQEALEQSRLIGSNLASLRRRFFSLPPHEMLSQLMTDIVYPGNLDYDIDAAERLRAVGNHEEDRSLWMAWAEGRLEPDPIDQKALIQAYLLHPDISGRLVSSDFALPRQAFEERLISQGLVKIHTDRTESCTEFVNTLTRRLDALTKVLKSGESSRIKAALTTCLQLLSNTDLYDLFEHTTAKAGRVSNLQGKHDALEPFAEASGVKEVQSAISRLLAHARSRKEQALHRLPGTSLSIQHEPEKLTLQFAIENQTPQGTEVSYEALLPIKRHFGRVHLVVPHELTEHLKLFTKSMTPEQTEDVARATSRLLQAHAVRLAGMENDKQQNDDRPVIIVPCSGENQEPSSLESRLTRALLEETDLDILIGGPRVGAQRSTCILAPTIVNALTSRISGISDQFVRNALNESRPSDSESFIQNLAHNYSVVQYARTHIALHPESWRRLFTTHDLGSESGRHLHTVEQIFTHFFVSDRLVKPGNFGSLKTYCDLLDSVCRKGGFTADSALFVATWVLHDSFDFGDYNQRHSPVGQVNHEVSGLLRVLAKLHSSDSALPETLQTPIRDILSRLFNSLINAEQNIPVLFNGVGYNDQKEFADHFSKQINNITGQLQGLLQSAAVGLQNGDAGNSDVIEGQRARQPGHPYFTAEKEAVFFLSGTHKKPIAHLDPSCFERKKWLEKPGKDAVPNGPMTIEKMNDALGFTKPLCCSGCKTPSWRDQELYSDIIKRFRWNPSSAMLPPEFT